RPAGLQQNMRAFAPRQHDLGQAIGDNATLGHDRDETVAARRAAIPAIEMRRVALIGMRIMFANSAAACQTCVPDFDDRDSARQSGAEPQPHPLRDRSINAQIAAGIAARLWNSAGAETR